MDGSRWQSGWSDVEADDDLDSLKAKLREARKIIEDQQATIEKLESELKVPED